MRELIYIFISGIEYGIWRDELLSIKDNLSIHHLPLVDPYIAGISLINDRVMTLADISACIGLTPISRFNESHILLISEQQEIAGFAADGEIGNRDVTPDEIFSIPNYLQTPLIDTCVLHGPKPVPVINISKLYNLVLNSNYKPEEYKLQQSNIKQWDIPSVKNFRLIEICGKIFAFPQIGYEGKSPVPQEISSIALIPEFIKGIVFHNGDVFPLISLSKRMKLDEEDSAKLMLISDIEKKRFGFLIDSDKGLLDIDIVIRNLPPLVQWRWMRDTIINNGDIIPIIDPCALVSAGSNDEDELPLPQRYKPNFKFESKFGFEDVKVVEFSLLGVRYALPGMEVVDYIPFKPFQKIPNLQPIVLGIFEHEGELLPVLDLALCFGLHSRVTSLWQMILIENGDFRAIVITDKIYGEEQIPISLQRKLPIKLPHKVIYGCYLDMENNAVRLILNVEAMSVYFEETSVIEFFNSVSERIEYAMGLTLDYSNNKGQNIDSIDRQIKSEDISDNNNATVEYYHEIEDEVVELFEESITINEIIDEAEVDRFGAIVNKDTSSSDTISVEDDADDGEIAQADQGTQITEEHQHAKEATSGDITAIEEDADDGEIAQADQ
ncbi:MAG: chemotaxis protein CheW, partial [Spirochaetota bacterium]|nr:chemotaxis protein CheW [Spirochaetota bacterium]